MRFDSILKFWRFVNLVLCPFGATFIEVPWSGVTKESFFEAFTITPSFKVSEDLLAKWESSEARFKALRTSLLKSLFVLQKEP
jgi:hypothetical protein